METVPPAVQMVQMLAGFQVAQALYAAAKLGVADQLTEGPRSAEQLGDRLQCDPAATYRLMRSLSGLGVFSEVESGRFGLNPLGQTLVSGGPGSMRDLALMWMETHYAPFGGLVDTVRTGRPAAEAYYGEPFFHWLSRHPEQVTRFTRAMANLTDGIKLHAVDAVDFADSRMLVDVGGADGALLAHVLRTAPQVDGVTFDLPHVVSDAAATIKGFELGSRLRAEGGDFFVSVPSGADTYLLSMILHDWDDTRARQILANIAEAGAPGSRLVSLELVVPPGDAPHMAKMIDLTMLGMLTGHERTAEELRSLVESAGLRFEGITTTPTPMSVLHASVC